MEKRIIAVLSGKGGVGKSTVAVNVACLLSMQGAATILIDSDFYNPCVFFHLGLQPLQIGLQELMNNKARLEDALSIHQATGLRCISASLHFYRRASSKNLYKLINSLDYDYIIIDCSPGFAEFTEEVIKCSTELFVLMTPDIPSATAAMKMVAIIKDMQTIDKIHLVLNRVTNEPYELHQREIETLFREEITHDKGSNWKIGALIPEDENIPKSISEKTPIVMSNPGSKAARIFKKFAKDIHGEGYASSIFLDKENASGKNQRSEFFSRLINWITTTFRLKQK